MQSFHEYIDVYKGQLGKGDIQKAYKGLMEYILSLKTHFNNKHPEFLVPGGIYYGYMDMTYFSIVPKSFQQRKLKTAVVFIHETCRFEAWLAGVNKQIQSKYWKLFRESGWNTYPIVPTIKGADSIVETILVDDPDFSNLDALTGQIERSTLKFIEDIETFLNEKP